MGMKIQAGDTITIPEGFKAIVRGRSVIFEKEEEVQEFKDGDVLHSTHDDEIVIFKAYHNYSRSCFDSYYNNKGFGNERWNIAFFRHATEEEKQLLFESMKERGLFWNADKKMIEKIRWRAKRNEIYYYVKEDLAVANTIETYNPCDNKRWDDFNYFKVEGQAEVAAKRIRKALQQYHEEIGE